MCLSQPIKRATAWNVLILGHYGDRHAPSLVRHDLEHPTLLAVLAKK